MTWTRRAIVAAGAAAAAPALAQQGPRRVDPMRINRDLTLASGAMADNIVARSFRLAPERMTAPGDLAVTDGTTTKPLSDYLGRTLILPVWAEWCAPCLVEMADFAVLQKRFGGERFAILPVLSGSNDWMAAEDVAALLAKVGAQVFAPLMEPRMGSRLYRATTSDAPPGQTPGALPCTLAVDKIGRVVARQWGARSVGGLDWRWSSPAAAAFVAALKDGFLETI